MLTVLNALWNSPTATSWVQQITQVLRFVAVTPLVLTRFRPDEIAAWFLFTSLLVFQGVIGSRVMLTFNRMIAFGMAGATDLSPIRGRSAVRGDGEPNWPLVARVYGTVGFLSVVFSIITFLAALTLAWIGLPKILGSSPEPNGILTALAITLGGQTVVFLFQRYRALLQGMNHVALVARWNSLFSLLSIGVSSVALLAGCGIVGLASVVQGFALLGVVRMRWLVRNVEEGRAKGFQGLKIDSEVFGWAREPFVKGMATSLANSGVIQLGAVVFTRYAVPETSAAFLLTHRMILMLRQMSLTPMTSHLPRMSRLLAQGDLATLSGMVANRTAATTLLLCSGGLALAFCGGPILDLIGSNADLLPRSHVLAFVGLMLAQTYLAANLMVSAMGNEIVCFWSTLFAAVCSLGLLGWWHPEHLFAAVMVAVFVPQLLFVNVRPLWIASARLEVPASQLFLRGGAPALGILMLGIGINHFILE